jgi:hypothetical protein
MLQKQSLKYICIKEHLEIKYKLITNSDNKLVYTNNNIAIPITLRTHT